MGGLARDELVDGFNIEPLMGGYYRAREKKGFDGKLLHLTVLGV